MQIKSHSQLIIRSLRRIYLIDVSKSLPVEVNNSNIESHLSVEASKDSKCGVPRTFVTDHDS